MEFISKIHGKIEYKEEDIIIFQKGIPGFGKLDKFVLKDIEGFSPFKLLHSIEDSESGLIVVSPFDFFKDYQIKITDEIIKNLNITDNKEVVLLTTVTLNKDHKKITTNLKAPLVINISNNLGAQLILDKSDYLIKQPLIKE